MQSGDNGQEWNTKIVLSILQQAVQGSTRFPGEGGGAS